MSDENTARHAECTVEFDGVDITSSIATYLLFLSFTDNEEDASDDLQIKLQDREGVWMTDWLQKMIDGDVSAASTRSAMWCSSLAVRTIRHPLIKRQMATQRLDLPRSPSSSRARFIRTTSSTPMAHLASTAGWMPARSPASLAAALPAPPPAAEKKA